MSNPTHDDGGPAFPHAVQHLNSSYAAPVHGMTLRDWFAGKETLADYDNPEAVIPEELTIALAGEKPAGGWKTGNMLAMTKWEAKWRAELRYLRADAMIAARKEGA